MNFQQCFRFFIASCWVVAVLAEEKAQVSGARRSDDEVKKAIPTAQTEAERVGLMNKLLRNRQFDVFKSGNSLSGAIEAPMPIPQVSAPRLDPKIQKRLIDELDRRRNWLQDSVSRGDKEANKAMTGEAIPDFSRDKNRSQLSKDDDKKNGADSIAAGKKALLKQSERNDAMQKEVTKQEGGIKETRETPITSENLADKLTAAARESVGSDQANRGSSAPESQMVWFQFGVGRGDSATRPASQTAANYSDPTGLKEFRSPNEDPAFSKNLREGFAGPANRFDPTLQPTQVFSARETLTGTLSEGFASSPATATTALSSGAVSSGFGSFGAGSALVVPKPSFLPSVNSASSISTVPTISAPVFAPRPAILSVGQPKIF